MVGLLLITHGRIGQAFLKTAQQMFGELPLAARVLDVGAGRDPEALLRRGRRLAAAVDRGDGVLILTDLFGSTPSNLAVRLSAGTDWRWVSGLNLPMLVRVLNYPDLDLARLVEVATVGGRRGVVADPWSQAGEHLPEAGDAA